MSVEGDVEKLEPHTLLMGMLNGTASLKTGFDSSSKY